MPIVAINSNEQTTRNVANLLLNKYRFLSIVGKRTSCTTNTAKIIEEIKLTKPKYFINS